MPFKIDPSKQGLRKFLKEHEEHTLRYFWDGNETPVGTKKVWENVNSELGEKTSVSRATIINFLAKMEREGVLTAQDSTGRGGHRPLYSKSYDEKGFLQYIIRAIFDSMMKDYPSVTRETLKQLITEGVQAFMID